MKVPLEDGRKEERAKVPGAQGKECSWDRQAGRALHTVNQVHDDPRVSNAPTHAHVRGVADGREHRAGAEAARPDQPKTYRTSMVQDVTRRQEQASWDGGNL